MFIYSWWYGIRTARIPIGNVKAYALSGFGLPSVRFHGSEDCPGNSIHGRLHKGKWNIPATPMTSPAPASSCSVVPRLHGARIRYAIGIPRVTNNHIHRVIGTAGEVGTPTAPHEGLDPKNKSKLSRRGIFLTQRINTSNSRA